MFKKNKKVNTMIEQINEVLKKLNIYELVYILGNKKEIFRRNLLAGLARGIGIGIGVTIITALIIIILQRIVSLNIPVIGEYVSDIIDIVEKSK